MCIAELLLSSSWALLGFARGAPPRAGPDPRVHGSPTAGGGSQSAEDPQWAKRPYGWRSVLPRDAGHFGASLAAERGAPGSRAANRRTARRFEIQWAAGFR